ncbi:MAG: hypothetical protein ABR589_00405 [Chthoniobacterales bacterium]
MKSKSFLLTAVCVTGIALCAPATASAQAKKSPSPSAKASPSTAASAAADAPAAKTARAIPFRGTASSVDQSAKTFTIAGKTSSRVFKVTDKTTVTKDGAAATLADLNDNDAVTGSYWKQEDGTLELKSLKIGGKTDAEKSGSSKKSKGDEAAASPSPKK